jgi:hypothetical protein
MGEIYHFFKERDPLDIKNTVQLETERNGHRIILNLDSQTTYEEAIEGTMEFTKQLIAAQTKLAGELNKDTEEEPK